MKIDQRRYDDHVIAEFQQEIRNLLTLLPDFADVYLPPSDNEYGKRVSFRLRAEIAELSWEIDSPQIAGPLAGSGDIFGDQVFASDRLLKDYVTYSARIRRCDGVIMSWDSPTPGSDPHSAVGWLLTALSGFFSGLHSLKQPSFSPNHYSRTTSVLRELTTPTRLDE